MVKNPCTFSQEALFTRQEGSNKDVEPLAAAEIRDCFLYGQYMCDGMIDDTLLDEVNL